MAERIEKLIDESPVQLDSEVALELRLREAWAGEGITLDAGMSAEDRAEHMARIKEMVAQLAFAS